MSGQSQMFRINPDNQQSEKIAEVDFSRLGWQERRDIQEWIAANPGILGDGLLIIGKEFSSFDRTSERLDLLAVDWDGKLVIIELKRDDTGADAHWQAIKYASYLRHATSSDIVRMLAGYGNTMSESDAHNRLLEHIDADDLSALNHDQRIILVSHRFAPEVTSAVLWLNEKSTDDNLITCVQLIPYYDGDHEALYVQSSTIIPLPGIDDYVVKVGDGSQDGVVAGGSSYGEKLSRSFQQNMNDEVTPFLRRVGELAIDGLPGEIRPDKRSRWGGGTHDQRYYHLWYSRSPWRNWGTSYRVNLRRRELGEWEAVVEFRHDQNGLDFADISIDDEQDVGNGSVAVSVGSDTLNDDFGNRIAKMVRKFIEVITPMVDDLADADNEEQV